MSQVEFTKRGVRSLVETMRSELTGVRNPAPQRKKPIHNNGSRRVICKAPVGGIAARNGSNVAGKADCVAYYINDSDTLTAYQQDGTDVEIEVFNWSGTAVTASAFIIAATEQVSGKWIVTAEDCT